MAPQTRAGATRRLANVTRAPEGAPLCFRQTLNPDHPDLLQVEQNCRVIAAVAGDGDAAVVDQNRHQKAECGATCAVALKFQPVA
jgi:hypothetical protein